MARSSSGRRFSRNRGENPVGGSRCPSQRRKGLFVMHFNESPLIPFCFFHLFIFTYFTYCFRFQIPLSSECEILRNYPPSLKQIVALNKMDLVGTSNVKVWGLLLALFFFLLPFLSFLEFSYTCERHQRSVLLIRNEVISRKSLKTFLFTKKKNTSERLSVFVNI